MQNCIMVALASRGVLTGTLDAVADGVGLATDDLRETLRQLVSERLIAVQTHPGGHLTVRVERRSLDAPGVHRDRRRRHVDAWRL